MLNHYCKVTLRTMRRQRLTTVIMVAGLSISMSCSLMIGMYIHQQLRYDRGFADYDRIYRQTFISKTGERRPLAPAALAPHMARLPEVEAITRVLVPSGHATLVEYDSVRHYESHFLRVDFHFFQVFNFPFVAGKPQKAL